MPGRFERIWTTFWKMVAYGLWGCIGQGGERKHSGIRVHFHINFVHNWTCTKRRFKVKTWFAKWLQWKLIEIQTSRLQSFTQTTHNDVTNNDTYHHIPPKKNHQKTTKKWHLGNTRAFKRIKTEKHVQHPKRMKHFTILHLMQHIEADKNISSVSMLKLVLVMLIHRKN